MKKRVSAQDSDTTQHALVRGSVLAVGLIGFLFFAVAFLASIIRPGFVEQIAKDIIHYQVEKEVGEKVEAIDDNFLVRNAGRFSKERSEEIALIKRQLSDQLPAHIARTIAEMRDLDCECRKKIETSIREDFEWRIVNASQAQERLATLTRSKYMETATQLTREFRIFTGTNALVFALLVLAVLLKRQAGLHLLPPALVLIAAALLTAYLYLFNQNWLHTLVFSEYVGFAYVGYLALVFALLCDIIFNRGRITTRIMNRLLEVLGSATLSPC